jgi:hypothetical protein
MNKTLKIALKITSMLACAIIISGCGSDESEKSQVISNPEQILSLFSNTQPETSISVLDARKSLKPGNAATIKGQIGGTREPFIDGFAGFVLADIDLMYCNEIEDDHCKTPWDACCEDKDKIKQSRITVQFVDENNIPITGSIKGMNELKGLDTVIVTGVIGKQSTPDNMQLNATQIYKIN